MNEDFSLFYHLVVGKGSPVAFTSMTPVLPTLPSNSFVQHSIFAFLGNFCTSFTVPINK